MPQTYVPEAMPSTAGRAVNMPRVQRKIDELELKMDDQGGLSPANEAMLNFWRLVQKFQGQDQIIVIVPHGALRRPGENPQPRLREVKAEVAAEIFAFASKRNQKVRLATEEERKIYRQANAKQREDALKRIATERAEMARRQMEAFFAPGVPQGTDLQPTPSIPVAIGDTDDALDGLLKQAAEQPNPQKVEIELDEAADLSPIPEELAAIGTELQVERLFKAGFLTLDSVAAASPDDLTKVQGIGPSAAAKLITAASEAIQHRDSVES